MFKCRITAAVAVAATVHLSMAVAFAGTETGNGFTTLLSPFYVMLSWFGF